jgi:hypothetical protein
MGIADEKMWRAGKELYRGQNALPARETNGGRLKYKSVQKVF